jgi:hypothetical protein
VKEIFNVLNDWVEKLYPELDIGEIVRKSREEAHMARIAKDGAEKPNEGEGGDK